MYLYHAIAINHNVFQHILFGIPTKIKYWLFIGY